MSSNEAFKALADPTRREILGLLRRGEMTAGALAEKFDMTKPSMSHHFAILKEADLITSRREGQQIWWRVEYDRSSGPYGLGNGPDPRRNKEGTEALMTRKSYFLRYC